jgi:hypothetical protein
MAMIWTETKPCTGGVQWEAYPCDTHAIDIWPHEKEGFSWCVITDDVVEAPEGWSATLDDAKRHAEAAYTEWCLEQPNGTAEFLVQLHALEQKLAEARAEVARERAAVVAWLREQAESTNYRPRTCPLADAIERGEHRREEGA